MPIKRSTLYRNIYVLFPGFVFYLFCPMFNQGTANSLHQGWSIILSLPLGVCIRVLSRYAEGFYFFTWSGHPGGRLLEGYDIRGVRFYSSQLAKSFLQLELRQDATARELFTYASFHVLQREQYSVVLESIYQLNRDLLTASIPCVVLSMLLHLIDGYYYLYFVWLFGLWFVCRYTAYLWAREVLRVYLRGKVR